MTTAFMFTVTAMGVVAAQLCEKAVIFDLDGGNVHAYTNFNWMLPGTVRNQGMHQAVWEPLFILNYETGEIIPYLGTEFSPNEGLDVWTLKLRDGVRWQDEEAFNADDVVFTVQLLLNDETSTLNGAADMQQWINSVEKVDDLTVTFNLKAPNPRFQLDYWSVKNGGGIIILPEHIWADKDPLTFQFYGPGPIGTGAYTLASASEAEFVYTRNDSWWGKDIGIPELGIEGLPEPDCLVWRATTSEDEKVRFASQGGLDSIMGVTPSGFGAMRNNNPNIIGWSDGEPYAYINPCPIQLSFNTASEPWNNKELRRAVNYIIDRNQIIEVVYEGTTLPSQTMFAEYGGLSPYINAITSDGMTLSPTGDVAAGQELIEINGYSNVFGFYSSDSGPLSLEIQTPENFIRLQHVAAVVAEQLRAAGIDATTYIVDWNTWNENKRRGNYSAVIDTDACGSISEPWTSMNRYTTQFVNEIGVDAPNLNNHVRWNSAEAEVYSYIVDEIGQMFPSDSSGIDQVVSAYRLLYEEMPFVPLIQDSTLLLFDTTNWSGWPTQENNYGHPATWRMSTHQIIHQLESNGLRQYEFRPNIDVNFPSGGSTETRSQAGEKVPINDVIFSRVVTDTSDWTNIDFSNFDRNKFLQYFNESLGSQVPAVTDTSQRINLLEGLAPETFNFEENPNLEYLTGDEFSIATYSLILNQFAFDLTRNNENFDTDMKGLLDSLHGGIQPFDFETYLNAREGCPGCMEGPGTGGTAPTPGVAPVGGSRVGQFRVMNVAGIPTYVNSSGEPVTQADVTGTSLEPSFFPKSSYLSSAGESASARSFVTNDVISFASSIGKTCVWSDALSRREDCAATWWQMSKFLSNKNENEYFDEVVAVIPIIARGGDLQSQLGKGRVCTGTRVTKGVVLTASHCVDNFLKEKESEASEGDLFTLEEIERMSELNFLIVTGAFVHNIFDPEVLSTIASKNPETLDELIEAINLNMSLGIRASKVTRLEFAYRDVSREPENPCLDFSGAEYKACKHTYDYGLIGDVALMYYEEPEGQDLLVNDKRLLGIPNTQHFDHSLVVAFGLDQNGSPGIKRWADVDVFTNHCRSEENDDTHPICDNSSTIVIDTAANESKICSGDSGAPILLADGQGNFHIAGVVSYTTDEDVECSKHIIAQGFTRDTLDWIIGKLSQTQKSAESCEVPCAYPFNLTTFCDSLNRAEGGAETFPEFKTFCLESGQLIYNGELVTVTDRYKPIVPIFAFDERPNGRSICTGTFVKSDLVLTARHCVQDRDGNLKPAQDFRILPKQGTGNPADVNSYVRVASVIVPEIDSCQDTICRSSRDIALLVLEKDPDRDSGRMSITPTNLDDVEYRIAGWGHIGEFGDNQGYCDYSQSLRTATMQILPDKNTCLAACKELGMCEDIESADEINGMICVADNTDDGYNVTPCSGDSGGPLFIDASDKLIVGVSSSMTSEKCDANNSGVAWYTDVKPYSNLITWFNDEDHLMAELEKLEPDCWWELNSDGKQIFKDFVKDGGSCHE